MIPMSANRTENRFRRLEQELSIKDGIVNSFLTLPDDEPYDAVLQIILEAMSSPQGIFGYADHGGDLVCPTLAEGIFAGCRIPDRTVRFSIDSCRNIWGRILREKKPIQFNKPRRVPEGHIPIDKALIVPVLFRGNVFGLIGVANKTTGNYNRKDREFLEAAADFMAPILHARLQADIREKERRQIEEGLRKSEARYRHIVEDSTELIARFGLDGRITFANNAFCRYCGEEKTSVAGKHFLQFLPAADLEKIRSLIDSLSPVHPAEETEQQVLLPGGKIRWLLATVRAIYKKDGRFIGIQATGRDITERKESEAALQESREKIRTILESITDIYFFLDRAWRFTEVNPQAARMMGKTREELLGKKIWKLFPQSIDSEVYRQYHIAMATQAPVHFEVFSRIVSDQWFEAHAYPSVQGLSIYLRDITDRKRAEEALQRSRDELEKKVRERTALLSDTNKTLLSEIADRRQIEAKLRQSEEVYRLLFERNLAGVFRIALDPVTLEETCLDSNDALARILGYRSGKDMEDCKEVFSSSSEKAWKSLAKRLLKQQSLTNLEICLHRKDGKPVQVIANMGPTGDLFENKPVIQGTMMDITGRIQKPDTSKDLPFCEKRTRFG